MRIKKSGERTSPGQAIRIVPAWPSPSGVQNLAIGLALSGLVFSNAACTRTFYKTKFVNGRLEEMELPADHDRIAPLRSPSARAVPALLTAFKKVAEQEAKAYVAAEEATAVLEAATAELDAADELLKAAIDAARPAGQARVDAARLAWAAASKTAAKAEAEWEAMDEALSRSAAEYLKAPYEFAYEQLMLRCVATEREFHGHERALIGGHWTLFGLALGAGVASVGLAVAPREDIPRDGMGDIDEAELEDRLNRNHGLNIGAAVTGAASAALATLVASAVMTNKADEVRTRRAEIAGAIGYAAATWNSYSWTVDAAAGSDQWEPLAELANACGAKAYSSSVTPATMKAALEDLEEKLAKIRDDARSRAASAGDEGSDEGEGAESE